MARRVLRSFLPSVELLEDRRVLATFVVINTNDTGAGSLRQAIQDANNNPGADAISFEIGGKGVRTIDLRSPLPTIFSPVVLDGTTQPDYPGTPIIELNGTNAGKDTTGLSVSAGNSTIRGLVINRFGVDGLAIFGGGGNVVEGNYLGTDATGTVARPNRRTGIIIFSANNRIGGTKLGAANLISGNRFEGIQLFGNTSTENVIEGNLIGTDAPGVTPLGNERQGMLVNFGASNNTIRGNVLAASGGDGVQMSDETTTGNVVTGNFIGTDFSATVDLGNRRFGVFLNFSARGNQINDGNVIAFNRDGGVIVFDPTTFQNQIRRNVIHSNGGLGIDLGGDGVTVNHMGGSTTGPNHWQNYPLIRGASSGKETAAHGTLNGRPDETYALDFYASYAPHGSFFGGSERYLGSTKVTTDSSGNAGFKVALLAATTDGEWLTATATDSGGSTSEFSPARMLPAAPVQLDSSYWTPLGPGPVGVTPWFNYPVVSGRVDVAAAHPSDPNIVYVGADGGGVWATFDWLSPSPTWYPLTDAMPSLNFNTNSYEALAISPADPAILYAAVSGPDGGILKSTDGGFTWVQLAAALFHQTYFGTLALHPSNPDILYVTVRGGNLPGGVYRSTDGGVTWANLSTFHAGIVTDLIIDPVSPIVLYAGFTGAPGSTTDGIYQSPNGGINWTRITNGLPIGPEVGVSINLAGSRSDRQTIYVTNFTPGTSIPVRYRTTNSGASWARLPALPGFEERRYWHALLAVDPTNPQTVFVNGDHILYRSTDGGNSWTELYREDPVHGSFDGTGSFIMTGDRGVYRWPGPGATMQNKSGNLAVAQLYTLTLDPTNPEVVYAIGQDHLGQLKYSGQPVWNWLGAVPGGQRDAPETGKILVDPLNPYRIYQYAPNDFSSFILRSDDGGATWVERGMGIPTEFAGFGLSYIAQKAFVMDPNDRLRLLVGTDRVYQTTNAADSWGPISPVLAPGFFLAALAIAPSDSGFVYAATADGRMFVRETEGGAWVERSVGLPRTEFDKIVSIQVSPNDPNIAFAVPGTYPSNIFGSSHVWMTTDGGRNWSDIRGDLPTTLWTNGIAVDWRGEWPMLYVATARGVFLSADLGTTWTRFGEGLPNASVMDLQFLPEFNILAAATFGRGVFEILVTPMNRPGPHSSSLRPSADADAIFVLLASRRRNESAIAPGCSSELAARISG